MCKMDVVPAELIDQLIIIAECDDVLEAVCLACVLGIEYPKTK